MTQLKGLKKLSKAIDSLKNVSDEIRTNLNEKKDWFEHTSFEWQESDAGQVWESHLNDVEGLLDAIESIQMIDLEE